MKGIFDILADAKVSLPEEFDKSTFEKSFNENYKSVNEMTQKSEKIKMLESQLAETKASLEKFDGLDAEGLKKQIATLQKSMQDKDNEYTAKLAGMEFDFMLNGAISAAKGKDAKAVMAMLDIDALKKSENKKTDIEAALKKLSEEKAYLFDGETPGKYSMGAGAGKHGGKTKEESAFDAFARGAGIKFE